MEPALLFAMRRAIDSGFEANPESMRSLERGEQPQLRPPAPAPACGPSLERPTGTHGGRDGPEPRAAPLYEGQAGFPANQSWARFSHSRPKKAERMASEARCNALRWRHPRGPRSAAVRPWCATTARPALPAPLPRKALRGA